MRSLWDTRARHHQRRWTATLSARELWGVRWILASFLVTLSPAFPRAAARAAAPAVVLTTALPSGQPVGTPITWSAAASGMTAPLYRFSVAPPDGALTVLRDFSPSSTVTWTPLAEGRYTMVVTVQYGFGSPTAVQATALFVIRSRITGSGAVVSPTANPLVALYSAPPCMSGNLVVMFRADATSGWTDMPAQPCAGSASLNVLVAGLQPRMTYTLRSAVSGPQGTQLSAPLHFTTGALPAGLTVPAVTVTQPPGPGADLHAGTLLRLLAPLSTTVANPLATDLAGHVVWYYNPLLSGWHSVWPVRLEQGGRLLLLGQSTLYGGYDVLREVDLAGDPVRETNLAALNAQLAARRQESIYGLHHDVLDLPNGDLATLGYTEHIIQGRAVVGDLLLVLDRNLQIVWTWNAFTQLAYRPPPLGETCDYAECAAVPHYETAIDWLHTNAIGWSPADHDLTLSLRDQDWVIKVAYQNGTGDGHVVWRLGAGGDFSLASTGTHPWFSHQHDAHYVDATTLVLFDDGNTRCASSAPGCDSRGQVLTLDERRHVATLELTADLGAYASFLGSAQRLANGNAVFSTGGHFPAASIEVTPQGVQVYAQQIAALEYRSYRVSTLYGGPLAG